MFLLLVNGYSQKTGSHKHDTIKIKKEPEAKVITLVDKSAEFPEGVSELYKFIRLNLKFPEKTLLDTSFVKCVVYIKFVINEDGTTSNFKILSGCKGYLECDEEAMRTLKLMPKWEPALVKSVAVKSDYTIPIRFIKD